MNQQRFGILELGGAAAVEYGEPERTGLQLQRRPPVDDVARAEGQAAPVDRFFRVAKRGDAYSRAGQVGRIVPVLLAQDAEDLLVLGVSVFDAQPQGGLQAESPVVTGDVHNEAERQEPVLVDAAKGNLRLDERRGPVGA